MTVTFSPGWLGLARVVLASNPLNRPYLTTGEADARLAAADTACEAPAAAPTAAGAGADVAPGETGGAAVQAKAGGGTPTRHAPNAKQAGRNRAGLLHRPIPDGGKANFNHKERTWPQA